MRIAVARETDSGEPRVAATPETVKKFKALGADVAVARGSGIASGIPDADFEAGGRQIARRRQGRRHLKVRRPAPELKNKKDAPLASWILTAIRPRSMRWPKPGSLRLPWN